MTIQNKPVFVRLLGLIICLSLALGACAQPAPAPAPTLDSAPVVDASPLAPVSLEGLMSSTWEWAGGRESASSEPFQVPDPEKYTLTFNADGSLFVQADCNTSRGAYELSGNLLTITLGATTLAACEPGSLSNDFLAKLGQAAQAGAAYGNLVIVLAGEAGEMYFQPTTVIPPAVIELEPVTQAEIVDISWQWTNLVETDPPSEIGVGQPDSYTLVLRSDGTYSAKADCNMLNGTYVLSGSDLSLNQGISSLAMCPPESQSDLYTSLLWRVTGVGMREGLLVLVLDEGAATMSYVNGGPVEVVAAAMAAPMVAGEPAFILGAPDGVENFDNARNWTEFNTPCFTSQITGGQFVMTANGQPQTVCWEVSWPQLENFYLETTLLMPDACNPQDRFGFLFRAPDTSRGYLYGFDCGGQYSLSIWDGSSTTVLVAPTPSSAIVTAPGAVNRMGLMAFGGNISMYANGVFLQTISDLTYPDAGRFGYFVRAQTNTPFTVRYDSLSVWVLEDELYPPDLAQPLPPVDLPAPPTGAATGEARVNVNVRTGPSTRFPVIGTAMQGDTGEILGINPDGSWYAVKVPTTLVGTGIGWSSADFVILTNPTGQPLPVITPPLLPTTVNFPPPAANAPQVVMREPATMRSGPTLEFPVFGVAATGSRAEVIGESGDRQWWAVRIPTTMASNGTAWVNKAYTTASNTGSVATLPNPSLPNNITAAAPASGAPALVTIEPLNVRIGPGNEFASLGQVARGTILAVLGRSPDGEFFVVNIPTSFTPSGQGWVPARFVRAENVGGVPVIQPPAP